MVNAVVFFCNSDNHLTPSPSPKPACRLTGRGGLKPLSDKGFKRFMNFLPGQQRFKNF